jgi:hypothetical protein
MSILFDDSTAAKLADLVAPPKGGRRTRSALQHTRSPKPRPGATREQIYKGSRRRKEDGAAKRIHRAALRAGTPITWAGAREQAKARVWV